VNISCFLSSSLQRNIESLGSEYMLSMTTQHPARTLTLLTGYLVPLEASNNLQTLITSFFWLKDKSKVKFILRLCCVKQLFERSLGFLKKMPRSAV